MRTISHNTRHEIELKLVYLRGFTFGMIAGMLFLFAIAFLLN